MGGDELEGASADDRHGERDRREDFDKREKEEDSDEKEEVVGVYRRRRMKEFK